MGKPVVDVAVLQKLIVKLEEASFFKHDKPKDIPVLKQKMIEYASPFPFGSGRSFLADAENMSEQGVLDFLRKVQPFLKKSGVHLKTLSDELDQEEEGYCVIINGERYEMCSADELTLPPWEIVSARAFAMVDKLLARAKAEDRIYCLWFGGNEQNAVFLTPRQHDIIKSWPMDARNRPLSSRQLLKQID